MHSEHSEHSRPTGLAHCCPAQRHQTGVADGSVRHPCRIGHTRQASTLEEEGGSQEVEEQLVGLEAIRGWVAVAAGVAGVRAWAAYL